MSLGLDRQYRKPLADARAEAAASLPTVEIPVLSSLEFAEACSFSPDPSQRDVLESVANKMALLCSRQSGKSTVTALKSLHEAVYTPAALVLLAAPSQNQSKELMRKVRSLYATANTPLPDIASESTQRLEFANGSRIVALPGSESSVRGFSAVTLVVLDEAARIDDELFHAIRPTLATTAGRTIALTTPWGRRGWFYENWFKGGDTWERTEIPVSKCPRISPEWLEDERRVIGELKFAQEYELRWLDADSSVFASDLIAAAISKTVKPLWNLPTLRARTAA